MGIQINGVTDSISAVDGSLSLTGAELASVGGVNVSGVVTATTYIVGSGSTSAPSISPSGDSNTGIFFPSADTIAFGEGGAEAARIDSNGRLGIGTVNPAEQLELFAGSERLMIGANSPSTFSRIAARNVTNTGYRGFQIDGSDLLINSNTSGNITLAVGGGSVGINSTSPGRKLDVVDSGANGSVVRSRVTTNNGGYLAYEALNSSGTSVFSVTHNGRINLSDNIVFASGQGIDFSATANSSGTMTSELLSDYEEGTWTPTPTGWTSISYVTRQGTYTKIGNQVTAWVFLQFTGTSSNSTVQITGLPFTVGSSSGRGGAPTYYNVPLNDTTGVLFYPSSTVIELYNDNDGGNVIQSNGNASGGNTYIIGFVTYNV